MLKEVTSVKITPLFIKNLKKSVLFLEFLRFVCFLSKNKSYFHLDVLITLFLIRSKSSSPYLISIKNTKKKEAIILITSRLLASEIVEHYHFFRNSKIVEHFKNCIIHHWGSTKIVFNVLWFGMIF